MESLTLDKYKNKLIYVISLNLSKKIKIGRGHESTFLLSDISVSRIHCLLIVDGKNIYLQDNNSKFGNLILIQPPQIKLIENLPLYFQVGRTFFDFILKKKFKLFGCCNISEKPNIYFYHKQNEKQIEVSRTLLVKTEEKSSDGDNEEENKKNIEENKDVNLNTIKNELDNLIQEQVNENEEDNNIHIKKTLIPNDIKKENVNQKESINSISIESEH